MVEDRPPCLKVTARISDVEPAEVDDSRQSRSRAGGGDAAQRHHERSKVNRCRVETFVGASPGPVEEATT